MNADEIHYRELSAQYEAASHVIEGRSREGQAYADAEDNASASYPPFTSGWYSIFVNTFYFCVEQ